MKKIRVVLSFPPSRVEDPVIYHLIKDHGLMVNILRATIDPGKQGRMVVEMSGEETEVSAGLNYLEGMEVKVEPLAEEIMHLQERHELYRLRASLPDRALDVNRRNWFVSYDSSKCVVCLSCIEACPYKAMEIRLQ
jgi:NAD-dependent dihydropyrimidine dehydrogenase PreA subunit